MVNNEHIYAEKVDGTEGIIIVDPNAVVKNGVAEYRYVKPEDLMIYVSVQAQMNSRTEVYLDNNKTKVINVASGKFYNSTAKNIKEALENDFMKNTDTTHFTTAWTEMYDANRPEDVEGFGITNIDIEINASLVPKIHIEFIDVRGKNLLERGDDLSNPYNVFYVFPYPLFQLTVKGYFGKAIQLPLVMEKAITRFDPSTGSYIISADFKSFTFAMLNDAVLLYALLVDKMYPINGNTFLGAQLVDAKYEDYYRTEQGQADIEQMKALGYANEITQADGTVVYRPLDRVKSLYKMFLLLNDMGTGIYKDDLLVNTKLRGTAVSAFLDQLDGFKFGVNSLATSSENPQISLLTQLVDSTNNFFSAQRDVITKLVSDKTCSTEVFNITINKDTYINSEDGKIIPMTTEDYDKLKTPIVVFERTRQEEDKEAFKKKFIDQFHFYPSVKNIVKAVVIHMDAFMELLRNKSELILATVSDKGAKLDPVPTYETIEEATGSFRRMPWPEFYEPEKTGVGLVKSYPGNGTLEQQGWGEVEFINEMYKASTLLYNSLSESWDSTTDVAENVFLLTPLSIPNLVKNLPIGSTEPIMILNRLFQQILDAVFHNGLLYKTMKDDDLFQNGIFDIMIKNVVTLMNDSFKTNTNGWNTMNLLKNQLITVSNSAQLSDYINKNAAAFDKEENMKASSIVNHLTFITKPYAYSVPPSFNVGNADYDHFKAIYKGDGDKNKFGIQQLPYLGLWESSLDLTKFSTVTTVKNSATAALTFTNNYFDGDMFITRPAK